MAKAKKRTTAERRKAAKEAWARRRAGAELEASGVPKAGEPSANEVKMAFAEDTNRPSVTLRTFVEPTTTATAVREGDHFYVVVSCNGSTFRHKMAASVLRKLGLDALQLVG